MPCYESIHSGVNTRADVHHLSWHDGVVRFVAGAAWQTNPGHVRSVTPPSRNIIRHDLRSAPYKDKQNRPHSLGN